MASRSAKLGQSVLDLDIDDSRFHSKLSGAYTAANKFTDTAGTNLQKAGKAISGVGTAWTRNITLPILAAGGAVAKMGLDFDTTFRQIVGLTDVGADEVDGLKDKILALAPAVGKGPQELAEALYFVVSAGFDAAEAMDVLEVAAKASATGLGDTQTVAKVLGSVINAYGHENITAAQAADQLTAAVKDGTAEASDYAGVIGRVIPAAAAMGVSFDQVTAALAAMTLTGLSAEEAATGLNQVFVSLLKPTTQADSALEGMGLSAEGLRKQLKEQGLLSVLRTLEERFRGNDAAAASVFGNVRALRTVTSLLTLDTDQLNGVFADTAHSAGLAGDAFATMAEGPGFKLQQSMAKIQASAITIGDDVLPLVATVLEEVANNAADLAAWWNTLDDGTKDLIVRALALIATVGPLLIVVGKLTSGLGYLFSAMAALTSAGGITKLTRSLGRAGLVGALLLVAYAGSEASKALGDFVSRTLAGPKVYKAITSLRDQLGELGDFAAPAAAKLHDLGVTAEDLAAAVEVAGGDIGLAVRTLIDNNGDLGDSLIELANATGEASVSMTEDWARLWKDMAVTTGEGGRLMVAETEDIAPEIGSILEDGSVVVGEGADAMVDPIAEALEQARKDAGSKAAEILKALIDGLTADPATFEKQVQDWVDEVTHPYTTLARRADIEAVLASKRVQEGLRSQDPQTRAQTVEFVNGLIEQYETLAPGALAAGELVNPKLEAGIDSNLDALIDYVKTDVVQDGVALGLDFSDAAEDAGLDGLASYAHGMEQNTYLAENAARAARIAALKPLEEGVEPAGRYGGSTGSTYSSGVAGGATSTQARTAVTGAAATVGGWLRTDASSGGVSTAWTFITALAATLEGPSAASRLQQAMQLLKTRTLGSSLPTAGPFAHPETGAISIGNAWIDALADALTGGVRAIQSSAAHVGDAMSVSPAVRVPVTSAMAAMALPMAGMETGRAASAAGTGDVHYHYHLEVEGMTKEVDSPEAMLDEVRAMSASLGARR